MGEEFLFVQKFSTFQLSYQIPPIMQKSEGPIKLSFELPSSTQSAWTALVELDQMIQWFFKNIPSFEAKVGFETSFIVKNESRTFTHNWKIIEVNPGEKITYHWSYKEYPGAATLSFDLTIKNEVTILILEMIILEDFPSDIPEFDREGCIGGWNYFIGERLTTFLKNKN